MIAYWLGFFISLGFCLKDMEDEDDTFKNSSIVIIASLFWPLILGIELHKKLYSEEESEEA